MPELVLICALVVGGALIVRWSLRPADSTEVQEWAQAHGLDLTYANRPLVTRYLSRVKRFRRVGAVSGFLAAGLVSTVTDLSRDGISNVDLMLVLGGYVIGIAVAELSFVRPVGSGRRAASLWSRDLPAYLPRGMVVALRSLGLVCVALVPLFLAVPRSSSRSSLVPSGGVYAILGVSALAIAVAVELVARWIVRRSQPVVSDDLLAADDAIRAASVHALAGAGVGLVLLVQSAQWAGLSGADAPVLRPPTHPSCDHGRTSWLRGVCWRWS